MKKIILCDGDSWTSGDIVDPEIFGDQLEHVNHPDNDQYRFPRVWPGMLDYETMNESVAGSSNDAIVRRVLRKVLELLENNQPENLFVIIGWTSPERKDFYYKNIHSSWETLYPAQFKQDFDYAGESEKELKQFYKIYLKYFWNQEEYLERYIQQNLTMHYFLQIKGIKHLFFDSFYETNDSCIWDSKDLLDDLSNQISNRIFSDKLQEEFIELRNDFFIKTSMQKYLSSYNQEELFDGNHPSEGGHREWANYIQKYIGDII
jgi:hypothetical protein|tara:strand:+ start:1206 stop:1991 length:786 start_codon:yes stop_codon:yes gene_type:complete